MKKSALALFIRSGWKRGVVSGAFQKLIVPKPQRREWPWSDTLAAVSSRETRNPPRPSGKMVGEGRGRGGGGQSDAHSFSPTPSMGPGTDLDDLSGQSTKAGPSKGLDYPSRWWSWLQPSPAPALTTSSVALHVWLFPALSGVAQTPSNFKKKQRPSPLMLLLSCKTWIGTRPMRL